MIHVSAAPAKASDRSCVRLRVQLLSGRGEDFKDEEIVRVIELLAWDTLGVLHWWILLAFGFDDDHLWEFYFGPRRPYVRSGCISCGEDVGGYENTERTAWEVALKDLPLAPRKTFYYVFDFGDSWWFKISVVKLKAPLTEGAQYPRIVERLGKSPEQYSC